MVCAYSSIYFAFPFQSDFDAESPTQNYSNTSRLDDNSPYNDQVNGYDETGYNSPQYNRQSSNYNSQSQQYDSSRSLPNNHNQQQKRGSKGHATRRVVRITIVLTHLSRMEFPSLTIGSIILRFNC